MTKAERMEQFSRLMRKQIRVNNEDDVIDVVPEPVTKTVTNNSLTGYLPIQLNQPQEQKMEVKNDEVKEVSEVIQDDNQETNQENNENENLVILIGKSDKDEKETKVKETHTPSSAKEEAESFLARIVSIYEKERQKKLERFEQLGIQYPV